MHHWLSLFSSYSSVIGFMIGLPIVLATYYESFKARHEARNDRESALHSKNCLEFVGFDGTCINLVPLETLHSLPRPGDVIMLPSGGIGKSMEYLPGAYLVESVEHIFTPVTWTSARPLEARLTKAVAKVTSLNPVVAV